MSDVVGKIEFNEMPKNCPMCGNKGDAGFYLNHFNKATLIGRELAEQNTTLTERVAKLTEALESRLKNCGNCSGDGYVVEQFAQCCGNANDNGECCGNPEAGQEYMPCLCTEFNEVLQHTLKDNKEKS